MTVREILRLLWETGHFRNPANRGGASWNVQERDLMALAVGDAAVIEAVRSYQEFFGATLDTMTVPLHGRPAVADGEVGPATTLLFRTDRCGCPDYPLDAEEATGSGSWPHSCLDEWPETHAVTIAWDDSRMPAFLKPHWSAVWENVVTAYAAIGLLLIRRDGDRSANLQASFESLRGSTIGLAIVPSRTSCSLSIWNKYDPGYRPGNVVSEWTTLVKHEIGHNLGMRHSRGGVMNPSIVGGLPVSWAGDPSEPLLKRWFGGEPVGDRTDELWVEQGLRSNRGRELWLPLTPHVPVG